jgi:hypothetical protein
VPDVQDFNAVGVDSQENDTVVPNSQSKLKSWRLQLYNVAGTCREISVNRLQYSQRHIAVNCQ